MSRLASGGHIVKVTGGSAAEGGSSGIITVPLCQPLPAGGPLAERNGEAKEARCSTTLRRFKWLRCWASRFYCWSGARKQAGDMLGEVALYPHTCSRPTRCPRLQTDRRR